MTQEVSTRSSQPRFSTVYLDCVDSPRMPWSGFLVRDAWNDCIGVVRPTPKGWWRAYYLQMSWLRRSQENAVQVLVNLAEQRP